MKIRSVSVFAVGVFTLLPNAQPQNIRVLTGDCVLVQQHCKLNIKQTKFGFEFGGIDFSSGPAKKVGSIKLNTDLIQKLSDIAQILDQMQLTRCQQLNSVSTCEGVREKLLIVQAVSSEQLGELAILAQMYSGNAEKLQDALLKWLVQSGDIIQKIYAKQFLAANQKIEDEQKKALAALEYATSALHTSPQSPGFNELLQSAIWSQLKR